MAIDSWALEETHWICPLYCFDCDGEGVELTGGRQIKPSPSELREHIREKTQALYGRWEDPSRFRWAVLLPFERKNTGETEEEKPVNSLLDFMTALRLCHSGRVLAGPLISGTPHDPKWSLGRITMWTSPISESNFVIERPEYRFRQEDVSQVDETTRTLDSLRDAGTLDTVDTALRRFHSAYHGTREDRLIDQMIAFESLYIADDKELGYKLALRTAFLLGKRKEHVFNDMKKAYSLRGQIVHGNKKVNRSQLEDTIPKIEEYLRQSMRKFLLLLSEGKSLQEIRAKLDANILRNGRLLAVTG